MSETIPKIAFPEYLLDLGMTIVDFVLQLKLVDNAEQATTAIKIGQCRIDDVVVTDPNYKVPAKLLVGWSLVKVTDKSVYVILWTDDNGLR
jgi:hypothetical protein